MKRLSIISLMMFLLALALLSGPEARAGTYTTNFPLTENPISEGGRWINGGTVGLDWQNVRVTSNRAIGTQDGQGNYDDATAILAGTWGPNQDVSATVYSVNPQDVPIYHEVELRLRTTITAHSITGYEVLFQAMTTGRNYVQIVRWNGPLGNFTYLADVNPAARGITTGSVVRATIVGNLITAYIDGVQVAQATDSRFTTGSPGIGFFLDGPTSGQGNYGFTSITASDGVDLVPPSPPKNPRIVP